MDDWKLKARTVVKLERKPNMFVSLFLSCLTTLRDFLRIVFLCNVT